MDQDKQMVEKEVVIAAISLKRLGLSTLVEKNSDQLDFHDLSVLNIRAALIDAYDAGYRNAQINKNLNGDEK